MVISFYEPILIDVPGTHRQYVKFIVENFVVLGYNLYMYIQTYFKRTKRL